MIEYDLTSSLSAALSMALLRNTATQQTLLVEAEFVVGRSPTAGLRIEHAYVSSHHAAVRWTGRGWQLRDLGSRNGTFLNGTMVDSTAMHDLTRGDVLGFGRESDAWLLVDDSPPKAMLISSGRYEPKIIDKDVMGIPSDDEPLLTAFRDVDGLWKLETSEGQVIVIETGHSYPIAGQQWRFSFPESVGPTSSLGELSVPPSVKLSFAVSQDEEHVELRARVGDRLIELGSRSHNYLLLTLARARTNDIKNGLLDGSCGWVYQDDLLSGLNIERTQLNIDIFRIRQHFSKAGLHEAINVIERRPTTKQLRLGTQHIEIQFL